jgi:hypothetical protein
VPLFYLDSSALVKLVREEPESTELRRFLGDADLISSELVLTEVPRAIRRAVGSDPELGADRLMAQAEAVLDVLALLPLDRGLLAAAGAIDEPALRTLDAIHLASAVDVTPVDAFVSYDSRQRGVVDLAGLRTAAPGA